MRLLYFRMPVRNWCLYLDLTHGPGAPAARAGKPPMKNHLNIPTIFLDEGVMGLWMSLETL